MCWLSSASTATRVAAGSRRATACSSGGVALHAAHLGERAPARLALVDQVGDAAERVDDRVLAGRAAQRARRGDRAQQVDAQRARGVGLRRRRRCTGSASRRASACLRRGSGPGGSCERAADAAVAGGAARRAPRATPSPSAMKPSSRPHARHVAGDHRAAARVRQRAVDRRERRSADVGEHAPSRPRGAGSSGGRSRSACGGRRRGVGSPLQHRFAQRRRAASIRCVADAVRSLLTPSW